jgi:hypothetical protein
MFTLSAAKMAATILGMRKMQKNDLRYIRRGGEQDIPKCMNLKNWFMLNLVRAAAMPCEGNEKSKHTAMTKKGNWSQITDTVIADGAIVWFLWEKIKD